MNFIKRNLFIVLSLLLVVVLAACGSKGAATAEPKEESADVTEEKSTTSLIETGMGEVEIPTEPEKIATLVGPFAEHLVTLGVKPYAADSSFDGAENQFELHLAAQMEGTVPLGGTWTPNMEAILGAGPDVILSIKAVHEKAYEDLSKIAPTVLLDKPHEDWRAALLKTAEIVGKEELAQQRIEEYEKKYKEAGEKVRAAIGEETVLYMRVLPKEIRIYHGKGPQGTVLYKELGLTPPDGILMDSEADAIQMEKLTEIDPDHIFLLNSAPERIEEFKNHPVWKNLKAVKENHVYDGSKEVWPYGSGYISQTTAIDYIIETLTK